MSQGPPPRRPSFLRGIEAQRSVVSAVFPDGPERERLARLRVQAFEEAPLDSAGPATPPEEIVLSEPVALPAELPGDLVGGQEVTPAMTAAPPASVPALDYSRLDAAIERLRLLSERLAADLRADALEVALLLARKIVEGELSTSADRLLHLTRVAARRLGDSRRIVIRLHPADAQMLSAAGHKAPAEIAAVGAVRVEVIADGELGRGDVMVEGEMGTVDGRLDTRFTELRRAIAQDEAEAPRAELPDRVAVSAPPEAPATLPVVVPVAVPAPASAAAAEGDASADAPVEVQQ